jgi:signal transduction histidine kinase
VAQWQGRTRIVAAAFVLAAVTVVSAWSLAPIMASQPAVEFGYLLIDVSFTLTALLLAFQEGQAANARLTGLLAASSLCGHLLTRDIGPLAPVAYLLGSLTIPLAAALILRYPRARYGRAELWWVWINLSLALTFGLLLLLTSRPEAANADPGSWWPNPLENQELNSQIAFWRSCWRFLGSGWFVVLVVLRWRGLGRLERRTLAPIIGAAVTGAALVAADLVQWWVPAGMASAIVTVRSYTGVIVALAFVVSALELRMARGVVADLAARVARPTTPEDIRSALRVALADPDLDLAYWVGERGEYVDGEGRPVPLDANPGDSMVLEVNDRQGLPLVRVRADPSLRRHRELVDAAMAVSALALENVRLQAGLRAQLAEVTATRARLLQSGFAQRPQLEKDLHDGAQQRLLAIGMRLAALESQPLDAHTRNAVAAAKVELSEALSELRDLAHGLYPAALSQGGLSPALEAVAERLPLVVHLDVPERRWPADVEGVAYLVVCEALANVVKHAGSPTANVEIVDQKGRLVVRVTDRGRGLAAGDGSRLLPGLNDRLAALGGNLHVKSDGLGTTVVAYIPDTGEL